MPIKDLTGKKIECFEVLNITEKRKNRWIVTITINYKTIYLGTFYDFEKAVKCRENAEIKFYGEIKL